MVIVIVSSSFRIRLTERVWFPVSDGETLLACIVQKLEQGVGVGPKAGKGSSPETEKTSKPRPAVTLFYSSPCAGFLNHAFNRMSRKSKKKAPVVRSSVPASPAFVMPGKADSRPLESESRPTGWTDRWTVPGVCLFLAAITFAVFGRTVHDDFVNYDDNRYVYESAQVARGLTLNGIAQVFIHGSYDNWDPLTAISHMLDCQFYGLNAGGHHLTNILLHTATAILLFLVLRQMTGVLWRSAFVAAVFAIHPLRVESVAWVTERKDVLSGLFFMLTIGAYVRYARRPWSPARYGLVVLLFALGLMSKPMLVTLPFVLVLLDYWPLKRFSQPGNRLVPWRLIIEKIPLLVLSIALCVVTVLVEKNGIGSVETYPIHLRIGNALISYVTYMWQMIYPAGLAVLYPYPAHGLPVWEIITAILVLASVTAGVFIWRRTRPYLLVGWLWYLIMLVPVIGIVQVGLQARADRHTYLPQIGLYVLLTWGAADLCAGWRHRRVVLGGCSTIILVALIFCARTQASYWRDSESLWTHTLACTPDNYMGHYDLGNALLQKGNVDDAIAHFQRALQIKADSAEVCYDLGNALLQKGNVDEAITQYQKALQINPDFAGAHNNLGNVLLKMGNVDEALAHFQKALQINPNSVEAHINLGNVLLKMGNVDEAITHFQKALQINPNSVEAHNNLGNVLLKMGNVDEAITHFQKALQINPDNAETHNNLGNALLKRGRVDEGIAHFQRALEINPGSAEAHYNLGNALLQKGRVDEAIAHYQKALEINPDNAETHYNLGNALLQKGRVDEAIAHYQKALEINPDSAEAHNNLGGALLPKGRVDEAIVHFQKALQLTPDNAEAHNNLGKALLQKGNVDEAIAHFQKALQLAPDYAKAHNNLGQALLQKGSVDEAIAHFQKALQISPDYAEAQNNLAWVLATCSQASLRNGKQAVELAQRANHLTGDGNPVVLGTLAAAYAEAGRFPEAVATAQRALQLAGTQSNTALADALRSQLKLYQAGLPFHQH